MKEKSGGDRDFKALWAKAPSNQPTRTGAAEYTPIRKVFAEREVRYLYHVNVSPAAIVLSRTVAKNPLDKRFRIPFFPLRALSLIIEASQ